MIKKTYITPRFKIVEIHSSQLICESMSIYDEEAQPGIVGAKRVTYDYYDDYWEDE